MATARFADPHRPKEPAGPRDVDFEIHFDRERHAQEQQQEVDPEEDERLLELKATGKPRGVIGVGLGRSTGAIIGRLSILNTRTARLKRAATSNDQLGAPLLVTDPEA
jgi:hypothetical protein